MHLQAKPGDSYLIAKHIEPFILLLLLLLSACTHKAVAWLLIESAAGILGCVPLERYLRKQYNMSAANTSVERTK